VVGFTKFNDVHWKDESTGRKGVVTVSPEGSNRTDRNAAWVRDHFGPEARVTGDCLCGHQMGQAEYAYSGGSHGIYTCSDCGRSWVVDLNGAMWPKT
jgi:hypothetical protein